MILLSKALRNGSEAITLHIGSHGGDVNAGITLYNFVRMLPIETHVHAFGVCESIAATVLLAGKRRTAAPAARITVHAPKYSEGPNAGKPTADVDLISAPFRTVCNWSDADIAERFSEVGEFRMTPESAVELAVINDIWEPLLSPADEVTVISVG
ncbi:ATP-dependent Clp protease proteolytic subunit [Altererythrobacter sp. C41]|uniref:ATP-dependent Clp protease proteolytic subunit n=1 Tax=Altererythrobacter sp. C41 TaxID=2806021 RepID=UPI003FCD3BC1